MYSQFKYQTYHIFFGWWVFVRGVFGTGGYCPAGICPGVYVRGVFVRGVFVLEFSGDEKNGTVNKIDVTIKKL